MIWNTRRTIDVGNPFAEIERARAEMERLFGHATTGSDACPTNLWANENGARLVALLPGLKAEDVEITVEGADVRLESRARRGNEGPSANGGGRAFSRSFRLPFPIDPDRVRATFAHGRLELELPRHEADRPRRIEVRATETNVSPN